MVNRYSVREFDPNVTTVKIDREIAERLRTGGFILHNAPGIPAGGVTVRGVLTALPDGTYSVERFFEYALARDLAAFTG
jgi:hypothetical protein